MFNKPTILLPKKLDLEKRREMMQRKPPIMNPEAIFTDIGYYMDNSGGLTESADSGVTDYYPVSIGDYIRYLTPSRSGSGGAVGKIRVYNSSKSAVDSWNCWWDSTERSVHMERFSGSGYFRLNVNLNALEGCYCYNATSGIVYYAGKNTPYYGKKRITISE